MQRKQPTVFCPYARVEDGMSCSINVGGATFGQLLCKTSRGTVDARSTLWVFFPDRIRTPTRRNFLIDVLIKRTVFLGENLMSSYIYV